MASNLTSATRWHEAADRAVVSASSVRFWGTSYNVYTFENFFHPLVGQLIQQLNTATGDAVAAMLDPNFLGTSTPFFSSEYTVGTGDLIVNSFPAQIDLELQPPLCQLQLGAAVPHPGRRRRPPVTKPAICRGAEVVPLRLRPHLDRLERAGAGPVLEVPVLPAKPGERRPQRADYPAQHPALAAHQRANKRGAGSAHEL